MAQTPTQRATVSLHGPWGHESARADLARAHRDGTLSSALLLHGPAGVGKQRLALWLAQLVLCEEATGDDPCGSCQSCRLALSLKHPDIHWYFPLARPRGAYSPQKLGEALEASRFAELAVRRKSPVRPSHSSEARAIYLAAVQTLRRQASLRPSMSANQVFVLGDAEALVPQESSPEAANALLKLIEEPPERTRFILTSSEAGRVLGTIRSRTLPLHLSGLEPSRVERFLIEVAGAEEDDAHKAAWLAGGSIGRALGFLPEDGEPGHLEQLRQEAFHLMRACLSDRSGDSFRVALSYKVTGARGLLDLFTILQVWIRDLAAAAAGSPERILNFDARDYLARIVGERALAASSVAGALALVDEAMEQASGNVNPQLVVAGLVARLRRHFAATATAVA